MLSSNKNRERNFGKYTLVSKLATGGMGEIFLAHFSGLGGFRKVVVIKRLLAHLAEDDNFVAMFLDEARIAAQLTHPNVCQVFELGQVDGQYFIAMEYLEGVTFSRIVRNAGQDLLDVGLVTALIQQACEGLHNAHELKNAKGEQIHVVHRDVSPSNLFVTSNGILKVLDFGIAKAQGAMAQTRTGTLKGKYAYMSPEQLLGKELDRRSDVFALGVVLFEALTGRRLFHRESDFLIFRAITEEPIPRVEDYRNNISSNLCDAVARALARDPDQRFQTIRELGETLAHDQSIAPFTTVGIAEFIEKNYHSRLEERRQLVENAELSGDITRTSGTIEVGDSEGIDALRKQINARSSLGLHKDIDSSVSNPSFHPYPPVIKEPASKRKHTLLLVLAALVIVGGATFAANLILGTSQPPSVPDIFTDRPVKTWHPGSTTPADSGTGLSPLTAKQIDAGEPRRNLEQIDAAAPQKTSDAGRPPPRIPPPKTPKKPNYSTAVRRKAGRIKSCFRKHAVEISGTPRLTLTLQIQPNGKVTSVGIRPSAFQGTTVGSCIRGIISKLTFPRSKSPVKVRIPLAIRISK